MADEVPRVALVCDYSLDYLGGAQSAFLDEARILRGDGLDVTVIAPGVGRRPRPVVAGQVSVRARWSLPGVDLPVVRNTSRLRARLRDLFVQRRIDVVHTHSEFGLTAAAADVAAELGIPVVHTVHTFFWRGPDLGLLDRAAGAVVRAMGSILRGRPVRRENLAPRALDSALRSITLTAATRAGAVISPSAHQAESLRDAGAGAVAVVPNALPDARSDAQALAAVDAPLRIAWVGRLVPEKRIVEFTGAVVRACDALGPDALQVTIAGDGPELVRAQRLADGYPVRFAGRLSRTEVRDLMRDSHLVALTSDGFDNQPVVVVEALSEGRSVLYVDSRLTEGLAAGGILADSADPEGMAETLVRLARHPEAVVEGSQRALVAAREFSPDTHARTVRRVYAAARRP